MSLRRSLTYLVLTGFLSTAYANLFDGMAAYDKEDFKTAFSEFKPLAEQGSFFAQYNLGVMYGKGEGVPQDYKEAVKWFRLAAEQGHPDAQYNLGIMYDIGQGVPQDYKEAVKWYRLAAEQGVADALYNLGLKYGLGQGVPQDYKEADKWVLRAAKQGHAEAQHAVFTGRIKDIDRNPSSESTNDSDSDSDSDSEQARIIPTYANGLRKILSTRTDGLKPDQNQEVLFLKCIVEKNQEGVQAYEEFADALAPLGTGGAEEQFEHDVTACFKEIGIQG